MSKSNSMDSPILDLLHNWDFHPSPVMRWERRKALELFIYKAHRRPSWRELKPVFPKPTWIVYFMYAPDGAISPSHVFTLSQLRDLGLPLMVVCAAQTPGTVPEILKSYADALLWKDLPGYDFSAYTLALRHISKRSPGADVLVLNDSVFGPFHDLRTSLTNAKWVLTGFTASNQITNHIQSYAFILRDVTRQKMQNLAPVFFPLGSVSDSSAVIYLQETRLARVAFRSMSVGSFWFGDIKTVQDPTLRRPFELIANGFPFLKRSLVGKYRSALEQEPYLACLEKLGHPVDFLRF